MTNNESSNKELLEQVLSHIQEQFVDNGDTGGAKKSDKRLVVGSAGTLGLFVTLVYGWTMDKMSQWDNIQKDIKELKEHVEVNNKRYIATAEKQVKTDITIEAGFAWIAEMLDDPESESRAKSSLSHHRTQVRRLRQLGR